MKKSHVKFGFELFKYSGSLPILTSFAHHTTNYLFTADDIFHTLFMSKRWLISLRMNIKTLQTNKTEKLAELTLFNSTNHLTLDM